MAWRRLFSPEPPPRLDGYVISMRVALLGPWTFEEWIKQRDIRAEENRLRAIAWRRGERLN